MSRLTEWVGDGENRHAIPRTDVRKNGHQRCCNKLAEYEDLEEQGRLKEQKQGEWIYGLDEHDVEFLQCPLCDGVFYDGDNDTFDVPYNYCPNCGAKMDEE